MGQDYRRYQPVDEQWFRDAVKDVPRWTFVDMGCGRGRALILAHEVGFSKLIGVEFSGDLCRTTRKNLAKLDINATIHCQDASGFSVPDEPCVIYFYNPFGPQIMQQVISRIGAGHFIIYINPLQGHLFQRFQVIRKSDTFCVYTSAA